MKFSQYKLRKKGCSRDMSDDHESEIAHLGEIQTTTDGPPYVIRPCGGKKYLSYINEEGETVYTKRINVSPRFNRN